MSSGNTAERSSATDCLHGAAASPSALATSSSVSNPNSKESCPPQWVQMLNSALEDAHRSSGPSTGASDARLAPAVGSAHSTTPPVTGSSSSPTHKGAGDTHADGTAVRYTIVSTETRFVHPVSGNVYVAVGHGSCEEQARERAWQRITAEMRDTEHIARVQQTPSNPDS